MVGFQTMGSQGGGDQNSKYQPSLSRQGSLYSLTLDEVQNQLGDLGKPLSSMNLDELLKNVWTVETNQSMGIDATENAVAPSNEPAPTSTLHHQASLTVAGPLSKKTVDEVWREIQQGHKENSGEKKAKGRRQPTLGEMTLEDFLVKAGVVNEGSSEKKMAGTVMGVDLMSTPAQNFAEQAQWLPYQMPPTQEHLQQQAQPPQPNMMGVFMPCRPVPQSLNVGASPLIDVVYSENTMLMSSPLMGNLSDTQTPGRKRGASGDLIEKTVERRQKRMIKNRESAARSRARKQAYTNELENKVSRLEEENERLKNQKEVDELLPFIPPPEPKYQLRRTSSAPL